MRHQNSVFHAVLKHVPWSEFDRLVEAHGADARVRRLTTKSQLVALLYGQLAGASSLREIAGGLASHTARLYHLGAEPAQRSTLADANARRPAAVFARSDHGPGQSCAAHASLQTQFALLAPCPEFVVPGSPEAVRTSFRHA